MLRFARSQLAPLAVAVLMLGVLVTAYTMVQQSLRLGANLQPQMNVEALATAASTSDATAAVAALNPPTGVTALLLRDGRVLASKPVWTGALPPAGALVATPASGEHKVTWQDAQGTRRALVLARVANHPGLYAVAFQPLAPVESIIDVVTRMWLIASAAVIVVTVVWMATRRRP